MASWAEEPRHTLPLTEREAKAVLAAGGYGGGVHDHDAYLTAMVRLGELVYGKPAPVRHV